MARAQNYNFKFVGRKIVWCFIALKNFKKFGESQLFQTSCEFVIFQIRIDFLNKNCNKQLLDEVCDMQNYQCRGKSYQPSQRRG